MPGYIKLYRQMQESSMYFEGKFDKTHAWIDLILLANYKDGFISVRGINIEIKRGQIAKSVSFFADRWQWSKPTVEKFFKKLESCQQISIERNNVTNLISIVNYERYQGESDDDCQQNCQQNCQQIKKFPPCTPLQEENKKEKKNRKKQSIDCLKSRMKGLSLEEKQQMLYNDIARFVGKYPPEFLRHFYNHWAQPDEFGEMRMEKCPTWETGMRLVNYSTTKYSYNQPNNQITQQNAEPQQIQF